MTDNWDEDDEWDADDDELDARLGLNKSPSSDNNKNVPTFDDEEDLAIKERAEEQARNQVELKKKGSALLAKKAAEKERLEELEIAKKAMALEAEEESNLSPEELKAWKQRQIEEADHALTDDLFGGAAGDGPKTASSSSSSAAIAAGDKSLILRDVKDHLKHAHRVSDAFKEHGKIHLAAAFIKELLEQSKSLLDDPAITDIIKTCNIIKNEKVQEAKRKVKGQAQKAKKVDKVAEAKARAVQEETFGYSDKYDTIDHMGAEFEDAFF